MSKIVEMYVDLITAPNSTWTIDRVPEKWRNEVQTALDNESAKNSK